MGYRAMLPLIMQTYLLAGTQEQVLTFFVWSKARNICIVTYHPFGTATLPCVGVLSQVLVAFVFLERE